MTKMTAEKIFEIAIKLPTPQERAAYVRGACGEDQALRQQVESLTQAHEDVGGFMPTDPGEAVITIPDRPLSEGEGTCIGRYKLLQKIGEGGMGVIYMAEQTEPVTRKVALKIIKLGMDTKSVIARFEAERQALAIMDHPNIAKVLDAGSTDTGRPYFVMELVKGVPINQYCDKNHLPTRERLQLFMAVCQAIQHAHQKGVIHRDIKPSNILVTLHDGKPVPKVIDFGIAKATNQKLTEKTLFTHFAQMIGTPAYMSPEQAEMSGLDVDTRTDVYSLGVLLYELLTGTTPFPEKELLSKGYGAMQRIIVEQEPERPSLRVSTLAGEQQTIVAQNRSTERLTLQRQIEGDLDWIVMKALEKDRTRRYDTPNNLAADIERHLSDEPVLAARPTVLYQLGKVYRRHKVALAAAACFLLLLTVSACVSTAQAIKNKSLFTAAEEARLKEMNAKQRETELRRIAETERARAETERDRSQRFLYTADMNLAKHAWDQGSADRMVELLEMHRVEPGESDLRGFEWLYLDRLCHSELLTLNGHSNAVKSAAFSPDGRRCASASQDGTVKLWDATTGGELLTLTGHTNGVESVAFSPDGTRLASASRDQSVKIWNSATGQGLLTLRGHSNWATVVAFSPDGNTVASAGRDHMVKLWDAAGGQEKLTLRGHTSAVYAVAFSPDGKRLASGSVDGVVRIFDTTSGREQLKFEAHPRKGVRWISSVAFSPDGKRLATASEDRTVKVWNATSGEPLLTLSGHIGWGVNSVAFSPDGTRLASAGGYGDRTVKLWDSASGQELLTLRGHAAQVWSVAFSPDGSRLISAAGDSTVKVWDPTNAQDSRTLSGHEKGINGLAFSPDGKRLASASEDGMVKLWDPSSGHAMLTLRGHTDNSTIVQTLAFSPDGKRLASASEDGVARIWDAVTGQEMLRVKKNTNWVAAVAFSPDGKRLALAGGNGDRTVSLWDAATGQHLLTMKGTNGAMGLAFSGDGKRIAGAGWNHTVRLWDATTGHELFTSKGHTAPVLVVAFSPDGQFLASSGWDSTIRLWEVGTGRAVRTFKGHGREVTGLVYSPDGKRLASASGDQTVKLWDLTTGQEALTLQGHNRGVGSVAFSPDGYHLASGDFDGMVKIWDATPRSPKNIPAAKTQ